MDHDLEEKLLDDNHDLQVQTKNLLSQEDKIDSIFNSIHLYYLDLRHYNTEMETQRMSGIKSKNPPKKITIAQKFQKKSEIDK